MPLYHVWFANKRRKWLLEGDLKDMVEEAMRSVAAEKGIALIECGSTVDHVHVLLAAGDRSELSRAVSQLEGLTPKRIFEEIPELKLDIGMDNFWQHRFGVKVVPDKARATVARYIRTQNERLESYVR